MFANEIVQLIVGLDISTWLNFLATVRCEGVLTEDFASEANTAPEFFLVVRMRHVVELDLWGCLRISVTQGDLAARF